ncbi:MAG: cytochrome c-type biogenesis CcmF C-terminal domain-containing protein [Mobilicoccus sp.]|nr:cytochrome c-type biogenesis CcmF C-terminal domain-containing protein [Mobilicoccus sp.]
MTQILGTALITSSGLAALVAASAWILRARGAEVARPLALGATVTAALSALAAGALLQMTLLQAGGLPYAERVTTPQMPAYYRVTAMWSALEGSLLLWLVVLAVVAALASRHLGGHRAGPAAAATLSVVVAVFAGVTLLASPFSAGAGGLAPSPLLQDHVAMGLHPPLLYVGFAASAVPFAWAVAAGVVGGTPDRAWVAVVRRWTLAGWIALTAGIALGAWWSYAVLGWGGYWAWDPVENASLFPWLAATALLHLVLPGRGTPGRGVVVLAGLGFVLVVLAQFLTRSGVVQSIHAFSDSPFGPAYAGLTLLALGALVVPLRRIPPGTTAPGPRSRLLTIQAVALLVVGAIVLVGTVLPAILAGTTGRLVSVGPPWYERTLAPVALVALVLLAVGLHVPARGRTPAGLLRAMTAPLVAAGLTVGVVGAVVGHVAVALAAGLVAHLLVGLVLDVAARRTRRRLGAALAHLGVGVAALAVVAGGLEVVREETIGVGGTVTAGNASATLVHLDRAEEGRRIVASAELVLGRGERSLGVASPELRYYEAQATMLTSPAIRTGVIDDVYVTLLDVDPAGATATVRVAVTPLISWLWSSAALLVLGGTLAALPPRRRRRSRVQPAPARRVAA